MRRGEGRPRRPRAEYLIGRGKLGIIVSDHGAELTLNATSPGRRQKVRSPAPPSKTFLFRPRLTAPGWQEVLEAEMYEALGASSGERTPARLGIALAIAAARWHPRRLARFAISMLQAVAKEILRIEGRKANQGWTIEDTNETVVKLQQAAFSQFSQSPVDMDRRQTERICKVRLC